MAEAKAVVSVIKSEEEVKPVLASKQKEAFEAARANLPKDKKSVKRLFWLGTLPGEECSQKWFQPEKIDSDEWSNPRRWVGRCPRFQGLNIGGAWFPAFTEPTFRNFTGDTEKGQAVPGTVMHLDEDQLNKVLEASFKTFYRPHDTNPKMGELLKEDQIGYKPSVKDIPLAHFVYLCELEDVRSVPGMKEFFDHPPKSLAGD